LLKVCACAVVAALSLTACSSLEDEAVRTTHEALLNPRDWPLWTTSSIPVCWDGATANDASLVTFRRNAQLIIQNSISRYTTLNFTGWGTCPASFQTATIAIQVDTARSTSWGQGGRANANGANYIIFGKDGPGSDLTGDHIVVVHEFMHVIGFAHEFNRTADTLTKKCTAYDGPQAGNTFDTPYDRLSVMNGTGYCDGPSGLSTWDIWGLQHAYGYRAPDVRQLVTAWSEDRKDHAGTATDITASAVIGAGYQLVYAEGFVFAQQLPGTVALDNYYSAARGDHLLVATAESRAAAVAAGYTFVRTEGYAYPTAQPGTVALKQYWRGDRGDNFATANTAAQSIALAEGYTFVRDEAYVFASSPHAPAWVYFSAARGDRLTTTGLVAAVALDAGYVCEGSSGSLLNVQLPGTDTIDQYWNAAREDHFATGTAAGRSGAASAQYTKLGSEGFAFTSAGAGRAAFKLYWNGSFADNYTTTGSGPTGYGYVRDEGYVLP
jgi:hypothetical protein